jgi:hypothetical protein
MGTKEETGITIVTFPHSCEGDFFCAKHEHETTTCQEEASQSFRRRPRREHGARRTKPEEKIRETPEHRKSKQKQPP